MLKLTITKPTVNVRRAPNASAAFVRDAKEGEVFEVVHLLDDPTGKTPEQWAKVILPDKQNVDAYICVRLPSGAHLGTVSNSGPSTNIDDYNRGFMDGRQDQVRRMIEFLQSE